jgi:1,4-alpha-glucan branching enzyme
MLRGAVAWWLEEMHGDGIRWDSVANVRALDGAGEVPGGRELIVAGNAAIHAQAGLSVAEDLKGLGAITQPTIAGGFEFDAQWHGFAYDLEGVLTATADGDRDLGRVVAAITGSSGGDPFARVNYLETHDSVGNGGARLPAKIDPADPASWSARKRALLGAVLLFTVPGVPMIFQGQESLSAPGFPDTPALLSAPSPRGLLGRACYRDLIRLRRNLDGGAAALAQPGVEILHRNDTDKVLAYRRHGAGGEVIVIVNLKNKAYAEYDIGVADGGAWQVRLDTDWTAYGDDFSGGTTASVVPRLGNKDGRPYTLPLQLGAYGALVLSR